MTQRLQAVYEGGVPRPIEPLRLAENQLVSVILFDENVRRKSGIRRPGLLPGVSRRQRDQRSRASSVVPDTRIAGRRLPDGTGPAVMSGEFQDTSALAKNLCGWLLPSI